MPEYAKDLMDYLERIGEDKPTKALNNPVMLRRALSKESPIALVGIVAQSLEDAANHPAVKELTEFERARVMSTLGRKSDAIALYKSAFKSSSDSVTRGVILINQANDEDDPCKREELLRKAIDEEKYNEALVHLGLFLEQNGRVDEAIQVLKESIKRGIILGIPVLGMLYYRISKNPEEDEEINLELIELARQGGIEDDFDFPFDKFDSQTILRSVDGKVLNMLGLSKPVREKLSKV